MNEPNRVSSGQEGGGTHSSTPSSLNRTTAELLLEAADQDCMTATPQYVLNFPLT